MIKLKDIIKEDADIANAKKIKKDLMEVGKFIETGFSKINKIGKFTAPGLRLWFYNAIKKNLVTGTRGFNRKGFEKVLNDWYADR